MKTVVEKFVESCEFMHKVFDVAFAKIELGYRIKVFIAPRDW